MIDPAILREHARCGPFDTRELASEDRAMLDDRLRVRFLPGATGNGTAETARIELVRDDVAVFVGARETYTRADASFEQRAAEAARFDGAYDPVTIPARGVAVTTGVTRTIATGRDMIALAHGWFLDANRDVLDVAVFVSRNIDDLGGCRRFAQHVIATVAPGTRALQWGTGAPTTTSASYAKFRYVLPSDWMVTGAQGIHDFAHLGFRRRGRFPDEWTALQLGVDAHPGDWASPGTADGERAGTLLGLDVTWHLTRNPDVVGAWTVSKDIAKGDHTVATISAGRPEDRDAAIAFAASIQVAH